MVAQARRSKLRKLWHARVHAIPRAVVPVIGFLQRFRRKAGEGRPVRSLWAGRPILTIPVKARAERMLGVEPETLVFETYFISRAFDHDLEPWIKHPYKRSIVYPFVFLWAVWRFDRFHFFCDRGLMPQLLPRQFNALELEWYRRLKKEVFFWTYGADVRTRDATRAKGEPNCCTECPDPGLHCICDGASGLANQARIRRTATAIFSMGDMVTYTPGSRNDLWFWPVDIEAEGGKKYVPHYPDPGGTGPIRIVHASNHRYFKGTRHLVAAVERLKAEGMAIELVLVEKRPNDEALALYRTADIVFDQILIGFHGYFALEAMAMGKPVVVFIRDFEEDVLAPKECPLVPAKLDDLADVLRGLAQDRRRLHEIGRRSRAYVERHYSVRAFSARLERAYRDLGVAGITQARPA